VDGAGVRLKRIFGSQSTSAITDPFLLLDHFGSNRIEEYISGFPWHPHRGIETVTYLLEGKVVHEDSEGHRGTIYPNDIQWMTAGSGIFHEEMPQPLDQRNMEELLKITGMPTSVTGMQLWINIQARNKMTIPTYRGFRGFSIPVIENGEGPTVKIVSGNYMKVDGILENHPLKPVYLDVRTAPDSTFTFDVEQGFNSMIYVLSGSVRIGGISSETLIAGDLGVFSRDKERIVVSTSYDGARFLLLAGKPLNEPVAWYGPIVMNSQEQIDQALQDLRYNRFVRDKEPNFL